VSGVMSIKGIAAARWNPRSGRAHTAACHPEHSRRSEGLLRRIGRV